MNNARVKHSLTRLHLLPERFARTRMIVSHLNFDVGAIRYSRGVNALGIANSVDTKYVRVEAAH